MPPGSSTSPAPAPPSAASLRRFTPTTGFWIGLGLFALPLLFIPAHPESSGVLAMAAVALLMAAWWISEAIPLAATALLPLVLFPLLAIAPAASVAPVYVNSTIFLFIGGFLIALAMERWSLHRRVALSIIRLIGGGPKRLVLSFMISAGFLSMWISNTATAIMMLAIGLAVAAQLEAEFGAEKTRSLNIALLLGIAYACSAGGIATLVGTPPNLALARIYSISFPDAPPISFGQWMLFGLPLSLTLLAVIWFLLTHVLFDLSPELKLPAHVIQSECAALGPVRFEERVVLSVFAATALLWIFRTDLAIGALLIPGWSGLLPSGPNLDDSSVAIAMALLLFLIPVRSPEARAQNRTRILELDVFSALPWHIVILFGGGFALASGFQESGLSQAIGARLGGLGQIPVAFAILVICLAITFLTEVTSNTATSQMILPILASQAVAMGSHPLYLMIPAVVSASCAFMMPVATPPNAIVFSSGRIPIGEMARVGLVINLVAVVLVTFLFLTLGPAIFRITPGLLPDWAILPPPQN